MPESFRVLQKELQSLGLSVELLSEEAEDQDEEEPEEERQEIDIIGQIEPETPEPEKEEL